MTKQQFNIAVAEARITALEADLAAAREREAALAAARLSCPLANICASGGESFGMRDGLARRIGHGPHTASRKAWRWKS